MSESAAPEVTDVPGDVRPLRLCESCGLVDDHPRHVFGTPDGVSVTSSEVAAAAIRNAPDEHAAAIAAQIMDTTTSMKHMDCCRADGCPDGTCNYVTAGAEELRGYDLVNHLTAQPVSADEAPGGVEAGARIEDQPFAESTSTSERN